MGEDRKVVVAVVWKRRVVCIALGVCTSSIKCIGRWAMVGGSKEDRPDSPQIGGLRVSK